MLSAGWEAVPGRYFVAVTAPVGEITIRQTYLALFNGSSAVRKYG
jgi:hypothetical protein